MRRILCIDVELIFSYSHNHSIDFLNKKCIKMFGPEKLYLIRIYHMRFSDFFNIINMNVVKIVFVAAHLPPINHNWYTWFHIAWYWTLSKTTECVIPDAVVYYLICMCLIKSKALYRCFKLQQEQWLSGCVTQNIFVCL